MQDETKTQTATPAMNIRNNRAFDLYLTFKALGGMIVSDNGAVKAITLAQFCDAANVDESTTWRWKKNIPNFGELVRQRRNEIVPLARESAAWNRLYLIGTSSLPTRKNDSGQWVGNLHSDQRAAVDALKTYLGHFGEMQLPVQRQDIKVQGGLMEVIAAARADGILEGEIVEPGDIDTAAGGQTTGALPPAS